MEIFDTIYFCFCAAANYFDIMMVFTLCIMLMMGYPASFSLAGTALFYGILGLMAGVFDLSFISQPYPQRIFDIVNNNVLIAVPLFILMGVILEKSRIAEELLDQMAQLFGSMRGGLGISVTIVGALLAASTGIVGATVVTMGLLSLPTMLKRNYSPAFASGSIAAAGTLGQIIPPSIVLILLGDVMSNAYQKAQLQSGNFAPETVSVGDLFAGALIPGLMLVGMYLIYQIAVAIISPKSAPAVPRPEGITQQQLFASALKTLPAPLLLILAVLGSILMGIATATEAAAVGAIGACLIAGAKLEPEKRSLKLVIYVGALAALVLLILRSQLDLRIGQSEFTGLEMVGLTLAVICTLIFFAAVFVALWILRAQKALGGIMSQTTSVTTMVFTILIGAALFSLVFRGLGGEYTIEQALGSFNNPFYAILAVMIVMFILGFFLDFIEITLVVVPIVAPTLLMMGVDPIWLGIMMAVNLQTSFLTPPFGFALFYLRGVAPDYVKTMQIYKGALPYVVIQIIALMLLALYPSLTTWLPEILYPTN